MKVAYLPLTPIDYRQKISVILIIQWDGYPTRSGKHQARDRLIYVFSEAQELRPQQTPPVWTLWLVSIYRFSYQQSTCTLRKRCWPTWSLKLYNLFDVGIEHTW